LEGREREGAWASFAVKSCVCTACFLLQKRFEEILRQELAWTLAQVGQNKKLVEKKHFSFFLM
jgi:hypothetical protein